MRLASGQIRVAINRRFSLADAAAAHRELETVALSDDLAQMARELGKRYAQLVRDGRWFSETRAALDTFFAAVQTSLTGMVRVKVFKGHYVIAGYVSGSQPSATGVRS